MPERDSLLKQAVYVFAEDGDDPRLEVSTKGADEVGGGAPASVHVGAFHVAPDELFWVVLQEKRNRNRNSRKQIFSKEQEIQPQTSPGRRPSAPNSARRPSRKSARGCLRLRITPKGRNTHAARRDPSRQTVFL